MKTVSLLLAGLLAAAPASAVVIDFSNLPNGVTASPIVYPEATFTSSTGTFFVGAAGIAKEICPLTASFNCEATLTVSFASAVNGLSFIANGDQFSGNNVFVAVTTLLGNFNYIGTTDGNGGTSEFQDLSGFTDVTGLVITNRDPAGLGYDRFTFDAGGAVPEPATWAMMIIGFGLVGATARRRATNRVIA